MNRTQKAIVAGVGTAVVLGIIAMVLLVPPLHTQTPASVAPPTNGGTGNGPTSGTNGTATQCNVTGDDHAGDGANGTDLIVAVHPLDDGNGTNGTGSHDGGACGATSSDPDRQGDAMSDGHNGHESGDLFATVTEDALSLAPLFAGLVTKASLGLASLGGFLGQASAAFVPSVLAFAGNR